MKLIIFAVTFVALISGENIDNEEGVEPTKEIIEEQATNDSNLTNNVMLPKEFGVPEDILANVTFKNESLLPNDTQKFVNCILSEDSPEVQLVNDTELIKLLLPDPNVTGREIPGSCVVVLFYSKHCPFSSMAAPHFNALPRAFRGIKMVAINAMIYHLFNTQNGIVGVPSIMLFHSGRPVAKFNDSEYSLELFSKFISRHTGITAEEKSYVTSADFSGPVTSVPSKDSDMFLILSWLFIIFCSGYYFSKSKWWTWIVETIKSNWRESEAHAHPD